MNLHLHQGHMNHQVEALCFLASNNLHHYLHSFRNLRHYYKKTTTTTKKKNQKNKLI